MLACIFSSAFYSNALCAIFGIALSGFAPLTVAIVAVIPILLNRKNISVDAIVTSKIAKIDRPLIRIVITNTERRQVGITLAMIFFKNDRNHDIEVPDKAQVLHEVEMFSVSEDMVFFTHVDDSITLAAIDSTVKV